MVYIYFLIIKFSKKKTKKTVTMQKKNVFEIFFFLGFGYFRINKKYRNR